MLEKPFGSSSASYEELSRSLSVSFQEDEMYINPKPYTFIFFSESESLANSELSFGLLLIPALGTA